MESETPLYITIVYYCNYEEMWQVQEKRQQMIRICWSTVEDDHRGMERDTRPGND